MIFIWRTIGGTDNLLWRLRDMFRFILSTPDNSYFDVWLLSQMKTFFSKLVFSQLSSSQNSSHDISLINMRMISTCLSKWHTYIPNFDVRLPCVKLSWSSSTLAVQISIAQVVLYVWSISHSSRTIKAQLSAKCKNVPFFIW